VVAQQLGHRLVADPDAVPHEQLGGQRVRALARPAPATPRDVRPRTVVCRRCAEP
jgi:hypothetical protein